MIAFIFAALVGAELAHPPSTAPTATVEVTVFECAHDADSAPTLRFADIARTFASVPVSPQWTFEEPIWKTTVRIPPGHYILSSRTKHCTGESEQLVAMADKIRHVTFTLDLAANEKQLIARVDEDMYASAVYGDLPPGARVDIMSADSIIGEQTRQAAKVDDSIYEFDHVMAGRYILRLVFGGIAVTREVAIPKDAYGATVRADLTLEDAAQIVKIQAAGSRFVPVPTYTGEPGETFQHGIATVDGWTTQLIPPSDYGTGAQRVSAPVLRALEVARRFLASDARIPPAFRALPDWSAQVSQGGAKDEILVDLFPQDQQSWSRTGPKKPSNCYFAKQNPYIRAAVNDRTWTVDEIVICP